jgi:preprotein translocase subunit SecB
MTNFEMMKLKLLKSIFNQNPNYSEPVGENKVTSITLIIRNAGNFTNEDTRAHFVQSFKTQGSSEMPFTLEVEFGAVFSMSEPVPHHERDYFIHQIFPQLVFPYMREYVAETTRRGGFPPLLINMSLAPEPPSHQEQEEPKNTPSVNKWIH